MLLLRLLLIYLLFSQPACSQENEKPVLLLNPTVYTGSGEVYENAALAIEDGKISMLADARTIRLDLSAYEVVKAFGLFVYPASLVETLPENSSPSTYFILLADENYLLTAADKTSALLIPPIQEGADATFIVTEDAIDENEPLIRFLVVKGQLKRENNVSLQRIAGDQ